MLSKLWPFRKNPDHAIRNAADARELVETTLADPGGPLSHVQQLEASLHSLSCTEGYDPATRAKIVRALVEGGEQAWRELYAEYFSTPSSKKFVKDDLWRNLAEYKEGSVAACRRSLLEVDEKGKSFGDGLSKELAGLGVRLLEEAADNLKLLHLRYFPVDPALWQTLGEVFLLANRRHIDRVIVPISTKSTSIAQQLARILMLEMAPMEAMVPEEIDATATLADFFSPSFAFRPTPDDEVSFCFEVESGKAPFRLSSTLALEEACYFGAGTALEKLKALKKIIDRGLAMPPSIPLNEGIPKKKAARALNLLVSQWSPTPPKRMAPREKAHARLSIVRGFDEVRRMVAQSTAVPMDFNKHDNLLYREQLDLKLYGFITDRTREQMKDRASEQLNRQEKREFETWEVDNISLGGLGAQLPRTALGSMKVGQFIGIRMEKEKNWIAGRVGRIFNQSADTIGAGVEILSYQPYCVTLRGLNASQAALWEDHTNLAQFDLVNGLILMPMDENADSPSLLVERGGFDTTRSFVFLLRGDWLHVKLLELLEEGEDFERVSHEVLHTKKGEKK